MEIHVFIAHMGIGGSQRVCINLANEWADRGHEVHIVVLDLENDIYTSNLRESIKIHELGVSRLRYSMLPMLKYIKKNRPPFMLIFGSEMAIILNKLRSLHLINIPLVVRVLNNVNISLSKEDNVSPVVEEYLQKSLSVFSKMEHLVAQCEAMGQQLLECGIAKKDKLTVIYNPVSEDLLKKVWSKTIKNDESVNREITFIGRIDPQKNPVHLIEAFEMVHKKLPDVRLRMVGGGNLNNQIKQLVQSKGLTEYVSFDGIRNDMENVYSNATVVALSSDYEGMPNCLIEAIGCGIPVVSYDCPLGPSEIIVDDVNGYLVPFHDVNALADKLVEALERKWDREAIAKTCDKFRASVAADAFEGIFNKLQ